MQKSLLFALILFSTLSVHALDNMGRIKTSINRPDLQASLNVASRHDFGDEKTYTSIIIKIEDETAVDDLLSIGAVIPFRRNDILLAYVPDGMLGELDKIHTVTGCAVSRRLSTFLDKALPVTNVPDVHSGAVHSTSYTGKGVTAGFSDVGFDPGHVAFAGRVKKIVHAVDTSAVCLYAETPEQINAWTTDSDDDFHATHVGGILFGSDPSSPYIGVAPGAEIVATTSLLDDVSILVGVEEVIKKAKEDNQPAVINLSLGNTTGPHDGSDLFCQYLDLCGEDAAILLSAGNDGGTKKYAAKSLRNGDSVISTLIESYNWGDIMANNGYIDIWSDNPQKLKIRFRVWDRLVNGIIWETEWIDPSCFDVYTLTSDQDPDFEKIFKGVVMAAAEVSPYNARYNITVALDLYSTTYFPDKAWSQHSFVIDVEGPEGTHVDMFTEGSIGFFSTASSYPWATGGSDEVSVSSLACGYNTVCVGSATTRDITPLLGGGNKSWQSFVQEGSVSHYSSYGYTFDGRPLPHFCAPGAYVVSAFNRHMLDKYPSILSDMAAESPAAPGHYYFAECGTSMASPHAAGIFALWLEANPALSGIELRDIAVQTAGYINGLSPDNLQSGAGMIDAVAGLRLILDKMGIHDVSLESSIEVRRVGNRLSVKGCDPSLARIEIYSLAGSKMCEGKIDEIILPSSIVIVKIISDDFVVTRKLL